MTTTEPVRLFGYTATGLLVLAVSAATALLEGASWRDGLIAALGVLAAGVAGTEKLRGTVWAPATVEAITAPAQTPVGPVAVTKPKAAARKRR